MYKVLLVDDEPSIREGLRTLIEWEEYGYQVVDTALNGKDALEKCGKHHPDLLIIDIRMPGMTGLEVIEKLRASNFSMHVLILSGYADFDYAKKAIAYNADGYLLKPVDEDELTEYLTRIRRVLDTRKNEQLEMSIGEWTRERVILSLLSGGIQYVPIEALKRVELEWRSYEIVLLKLLSRSDIDPAIIASIKEQLTSSFDFKNRGAVFTIDSYLGIAVKNGIGSELNSHSLHKELSSIIHEEGYDFAAVTGGEVDSLGDVGQSYMKALKIMKKRFFLDADHIHDEKSMDMPEFGDTDPRVSKASEASDDELNRLYMAVDIANAEAIAMLIRQSGASMQAKGLSEEEVKARFSQLISELLSKFASHHPDMHHGVRELSSGLMEIQMEVRYESLLRRIINLLQTLAGQFEVSGEEKQVKKMINYIQRNYQENLKLETLAEMLNYNSAYLGKLFKNATGEYFNTYLDKVRIEQAKLLLDQGKKVYQVAELVGYTNVDYFHSKFRKYVGMAPTAYKKKE